MNTEPTHSDRIEIAPTAIATIAGHAVRRTYGVVGMAARNVMNGITSAITHDAHKGIDVHIGADDSVRISVYVIMEYGTNLAAVSRSVAKSVRHEVEHVTGIAVAAVDVYVQGLRITNPD